jgi:hypothetical protein
MQLNKHVKVIIQLKTKVWVEQHTGFLGRLDSFSSFFAYPEMASYIHLFPYSTYPYLPATQIHEPEQEAHSSLKLLQQL